MKKLTKILVLILCLTILPANLSGLKCIISAQSNNASLSNVPSSDKIDAAVTKRILKAAGDNITVGLWLKDIDHKSIENKAMEKAGITYLDKSSAGAVQKYIEIKRNLLKEAYTSYNNTFCQQNLSNENVLFVSNYSPLIIANIPAKSVESISEGNAVTVVEMYYNTQKSEEESYNVANIRADYNRDTANLRGSGVKIGVLEVGYPDLTNPQLSDRNIILDVPESPASNGISSHATQITSIIAGKTDGIVPDATVYCAAAKNRVGDYEKIEWLISQGVNVINYSAGYQTDRGLYTDMAKWMDHLAFESDVIFVKSAGNNGPNSAITDPGMAYNGITVGSMCNNKSANEPDWTDDYFSSSSAYLEYEGGYKPDFSAPGEGISVAGFPNCNGTSYSAPHVTAIVAQMYQLKQDLKYKPCALNALLKNGTKHKTANDYGTYPLCPDYSNKEGAGVIDAKGAYNQAIENRYQELELDGSKFPYSKQISVSDLTTPVRVAVNWLKQNSISNGTITDRALANLDLYVYHPDGTLARSSCSENNNTELVEFMPKVKGTYTIKITGSNLVNPYEVVGLSWNQAEDNSPVVTPTPTPQVESSRSWSFSHWKWSISAGTLNYNLTIMELKLFANRTHTMEIKKLPKTLQNIRYDYCLSMEGAGSTSYRAMRFQVNGPCSIEVIGMSSDNTQKTLGIYNSSGVQLGSIPEYSYLSSGTYNYTGGADYLYIYSTNGGINVYCLNVNDKN